MSAIRDLAYAVESLNTHHEYDTTENMANIFVELSRIFDIEGFQFAGMVARRHHEALMSFARVQALGFASVEDYDNDCPECDEEDIENTESDVVICWP